MKLEYNFSGIGIKSLVKELMYFFKLSRELYLINQKKDCELLLTLNGNKRNTLDKILKILVGILSPMQ